MRCSVRGEQAVAASGLRRVGGVRRRFGGGVRADTLRRSAEEERNCLDAEILDVEIGWTFRA